MRLPYQALMYGIPILAVLIVLPSGQITSLHGLIDAMKTVYTVYGGDVSGSEVTLTGAGAVLGTLSAVVFIWVLIASGSAWIMGAGRAQAAACLVLWPLVITWFGQVVCGAGRPQRWWRSLRTRARSRRCAASTSGSRGWALRQRR